MVAILLEGALLLQRGEAIRVRDLAAEIELLLADGTEVAGREIAQRLQLIELIFCERRLEHALEEETLARVVKIAEFQLEREPTHHGRIKILREVRRRDHHAVEVFHLLEKLVHLRNLPAVARTATVLQKSIHFVEKEDGMLGLRAAECPGDVLLRLADPLGEQIAPFHDEHLPVKRLAEILHELRLPRAGRPEEQNVHAGLVLRRQTEVRIKVVPHGLDDARRRNLPLDVEPVERIVLRGKEGMGILHAHELAVRLHERGDKLVHLLRRRRHALHVLKNG